MSFSGSTEYNNMGQGIGPGGFGFGGGMGMGGFGLIGLLGLGDILDRHKHGDDDGCGKQAVLLAAIGNAKDVSVAEARALAGEICDVKANVKDAMYASAIQAERNTQEIKNQAAAIAVVADKRFDDLAADSARQTAAVLAAIAQAEVQRLRDELEQARHSFRAKEVELNITNTNTAVATAMQQQQQQQAQKDFDIHRRFDALFSQVAKSSQDIINVGGLLAGVSQAANPTNVK